MSKSRVDHGNPLAGARYGAAVYQAQGMVSVQANCSQSEALRMMREHARVDGRTLEEIARAVVARRIRFD